MGVEYTERQMRARRAEQLAAAAVAFVRRARREGHTNQITTLLVQEIAETRNIGGDQYSMRTVKIWIKLTCQDSGELDLIAPHWGRT